MNDHTQVSPHAHFEELCVLASLGELSAQEYRDLSEHLGECAGCREIHADVLDLVDAHLPLVAPEQAAAPKTLRLRDLFAKTNYKARFSARASGLGIEISPERGGVGAFWRKLYAFSMSPVSHRAAVVAVPIAVLAVSGLLSRRWRESEQRNAAVGQELTQLSRQNELLRQQVDQLVKARQDAEADLLNTRASNLEQSARLHDVEEQLHKGNAMFQVLQSQLKAAREKGMQDEQNLKIAQSTLADMTQEIAKLRDFHDANTVSQQVQLAELSRRAKEQADLIDQQRKLLAVDHEVRSLMSARSLHITDVFDVDGKGKKKSAFGRVFYTEGKSLIFYAFDLDTARSTAKRASFQAWGQVGDSLSAAVSLGVFYVDDPLQKRWIVKFDNPEVLKQIDAVFVTAEPPGGAPHPTGQKLMYAYLGSDPNHP